MYNIDLGSFKKVDLVITFTYTMFMCAEDVVAN